MGAKKTAAGNKPRPKANALMPSMREKKRYVAYEILSERPLPPDADRQLIARMNELLGVFGSSKAGIMRVKYSAKSQRGLMRVDRAFTDYARACFVMIKSLGPVKIMVRTLRVSGMLNKAGAELDEKKV